MDTCRGPIGLHRGARRRGRRSVATVFVDDLDAHVAAIAAAGSNLMRRDIANQCARSGLPRSGRQRAGVRWPSLGAGLSTSRHTSP